MPTRLQDYLYQQGMLRGFREQMAQGGVQGGAGGAGGAKPPARAPGLSQQANQRGGSAYPRTGLGGALNKPPAGGGQMQPKSWLSENLPSVLGTVGSVLGGPLVGAGVGMLAGALGGGGGGGGGGGAAPQPTESERSLYQAYQQRALGGEGGLPEGYLQEALSQGMAGIGAQAQRSRETLMSGLGRRGMLHSGLYASGLGDIERGRLGAFGSLSAALRQQDMLARRQAQEAAAGRYSQRFLQAQRIASAEPQWYESIGPLASAYAQYRATRRLPDYMGPLRAALGQSTPTGPGRGVAGPDFTEYPPY